VAAVTACHAAERTERERDRELSSIHATS
jgi:hypothetical protein